jgi:hypothetical protein
MRSGGAIWGRTLDENLLDALWPDLDAGAVLEELAMLALGGERIGGVVFLHGGEGRAMQEEGQWASYINETSQLRRWVGEKPRSRSEMDRKRQEGAIALEIASLCPCPDLRSLSSQSLPPSPCLFRKVQKRHKGRA